MLQDHRAEAYAIIDNIGRQPAIDQVRIFNKEGRITFSTDRGEIGQGGGQRAEGCRACHAESEPLPSSTSPTAAASSGTGRTASSPW